MSDEVLATFLEDLAASPSRRRMLRTEQRRIVPPSVRRAQEFQDETEQLTRYLRVNATVRAA